MNLVLLDECDLVEPGRALLRGDRARHIHQIHRAAAGDTLRVGLVGGLIGQAVVEAVDPDETQLSVQFSEAPPAPLGLDLVLALPRPKLLRRLLAAVASMGVKRIALVNSARVEKSYFDSPLVAPASIAEALRLGLSQARDTILPTVSIHHLFRPFVEDEVAGLWPAPARRLLAHPDADRGLPDVLQAPRANATATSPAVLAVGPEGGWVPFEVGLLEAQGFECFTSGPRILRVDTAVPFLLGQFALLAAGLPPG